MLSKDCRNHVLSSALFKILRCNETKKYSDAFSRYLIGSIVLLPGNFMLDQFLPHGLCKRTSDRSWTQIKTTFTKRKRAVPSINDKEIIISRLDKGEKGTYLAQEFGINKQQISDIRKNKDKILKFTDSIKTGEGLKQKSLKLADDEQLDKALKSLQMHTGCVDFAIKMMFSALYTFCSHFYLIHIHIFDYPDSRVSGLFTEVTTSPDNRGSPVYVLQAEMKFTWK